MTRIPYSPGARQAKSEIPAGEQRVKAVYPDVRARHWGGPHHLEDGWKIEIIDVEGKYTVCIGAARDRDAAFADAASKLPASLPAEGPDEHQCTWTCMTCDACPECEGCEHVDRKVWPNAPLPAEGVALTPIAPTKEDRLIAGGWLDAYDRGSLYGIRDALAHLAQREREQRAALSESAALRKQLEETRKDLAYWANRCNSAIERAETAEAKLKENV